MNNETVSYLKVEEIKSKNNLVFLDAREPKEFNVSHIENAIYVGFDNFDQKKVTSAVKDKNANIVVFSVEDKTYRIQTLYNDYNINAYVWKSRDGLRELKQALQKIYNSESFYISPHCANAISKSEAVEIVDYDIFLIKCLSDGYSQEQISDKLKEKKWSPTSISSIEKK